MIHRACGCPGCGRYAVGSTSFCALHRATTTRSGHGRRHQLARRALARSLPRPCAYCGEVIERGEPFVAAHVIDGRHDLPRVPAHPLCNERAKAPNPHPRYAEHA